MNWAMIWAKRFCTKECTFLTKICSKIYVLRGNPSKTTLRIFSTKEMGGTPNSAKGFR